MSLYAFKKVLKAIRPVTGLNRRSETFTGVVSLLARLAFDHIARPLPPVRCSRPTMARSTRYSSFIEPRRHMKLSAIATTTSKQGERDVLVIGLLGLLGATSLYAGVVGLRVGGVRGAGRRPIPSKVETPAFRASEASGPALKADKMEVNGPLVGTTHAFALAVCEASEPAYNGEMTKDAEHGKTYVLAPAASEASGPEHKDEMTTDTRITTHTPSFVASEVSGLALKARETGDANFGGMDHTLLPLRASEASGPAPEGGATIQRTHTPACRASEASGPALTTEKTMETENDTLRASEPTPQAPEPAPWEKDSRLKKSTMGSFLFTKREPMPTTREKKPRDVAVEALSAVGAVEVVVDGQDEEYGGYEEFSEERMATFSDWAARNGKHMESSPEGAAAERSDGQGGKYGGYGELSEEQMATFADWAARNGKHASLEPAVSSALALGLKDGQGADVWELRGYGVDHEEDKGGKAHGKLRSRRSVPTANEALIQQFLELVANPVTEPPAPPTINRANGEAEWSVVAPTRKARRRRDKGEEGTPESGREVGVTYREAACAGAGTYAYDGGEDWGGGWSSVKRGRRGWA
ncbi:hypothetical protein DXG01_003743 [Tephrocybe rancida]|nr:hypothetical protein DXG01_003743 [Tephrocybe rancida]